MAGIYSQGGSAGHRYAGWLSEVEAKNFQFGGKVFNGSPSAIFVGDNLVWGYGLTHATMQAIVGAFGATDGKAVINATNAYLNGIAAQGAAGKAKAQALADWLNTYAIEDAHIVYSLVPTLGKARIMVAEASGRGNGAYINAGWPFASGWELEIDFWKITNDGSSGSLWVPVMGSGSYSPSSNNRTAFINSNTGGLSIDTVYIDQSSHGMYVAETVNTIKMNATSAEFNGNSLTYGRDGNTQITEPASPRDLYLFCSNNNGRNWRGSTELCGFRMKINGTYTRYEVPFVRNNVNGWLDLVTETFYTNYNSVGFFTIKEEPWTPSTP